MKKQTLTILCGFILIGLLSGCAVHKTYGPYEGKVVDSETGQPIEGAALHMVFYTQTGNPGGSSSIYAGDKEVVTDSEGKFNLSQSLWTFRPLHFWGEPPLVCLFKPGYGTFPRHQQANIASPKGLEQIPEGQFTTIELPPLKTSKERWENLSKVYISVMDSNKYQSKVYKLKEEELHIIEEMRGQKKLNMKILIALMFVILSPISSLSFNEDIVHPEINDKAFTSEISASLTNELQLSTSIVFAIKDAISNGGRIEDEGVRPFNHFLDPIQPWEKAGLWGSPSPAVVWAQSYNNDASWQSARESYFQALLNNSEEDYIATFTKLGQIMHLVSDMAVPAHVRNDPHPEVTFPDWVSVNHFEVYTKNNPDSLDVDGTTHVPDFSLFDRCVALEPVSALFDINEYDGSTPEDATTPSVGLAEYTNSHFLSEGTIFKNYAHPYTDNPPKIVPVLSEDGVTDYPQYIYSQLDPTMKLAAVSYLSDFANDLEPGVIGLKYQLDDAVFEDYAKRLVPRAVGYSSAVLKYFFRGKLEVSALPVILNNNIYGVYCIVKNISESQETLGNGTFSFTITAPGVAVGAPTYRTGGCTDFFEEDDTLEYGETMEFFVQFDKMFALSDFANWEDVECTAIFRGELGKETDAVIGKKFHTKGLVFNEEWNSLSGEYVWTHTSQDDENLYDNGTTLNIVENSVLIKENVRTSGNNARYNSTFHSFVDEDNPNGLLINKNTFVEYIVPQDFTVNPPPNYQATQGITLYLGEYRVHFTNNNPWLWYDSSIAIDWEKLWINYYYTPETIMIDNIFDLFEKSGFEVPTPLYLQGITIGQEVFTTSGEEAITQHLEVDSFRIIDAETVVNPALE